MQILGAIVFVFVLWTANAEAACSGSGLTWTCQEGSTIADVETAMSSASDGAVITFASGSYTWNTGILDAFSSAKGVTLICEAVQTCDITLSTSLMLRIAYSGDNDKLYRFSGFNLTGSCSSGNCIQIYHATSGATIDRLRKFRFDHNRLTNLNIGNDGFRFAQIGAIDRGGEVYGVVDHNTVTAAQAHIFFHTMGDGGVGSVVWGASARGTENALYFEDNTLTFTDDGLPLYHCNDAWHSGKYVWRYNTVTNCRVATHGVLHGGVKLFEVYRNTITGNSGGNRTWNDCWRCIHSQGSGEIYVFQNKFYGASTVRSGAIVVQHYRSDSANSGTYGVCDGTQSVDGNTAPEATYRGWPCLAQPGRMEVGGTPSWGKLAPMFAFGNTSGHDNTIRNITVESSGYIANHLVANRDYYNAVNATAQISPSTPFNGTTGMGYGTLANRPTTCTHMTAPDGDEGGGVMYWATDQGSWNLSGPSGVLYRCSAANIWTVHYTPYTYPHPLQRLVTATSTDLSAIPTGVRVR